MDRITKKQALTLFKSADLLGLGMTADNIRKKLHPDGTVTFIIDRNINYTNVCINKCTFCAFWRDEKDPEAYVLNRRKLFNKIKETISLGGTQILIQGGLHPGLDIDYYVDLLKTVKEKFNIHVHGFSPPEICYMADKAGFSIRKTLRILNEAGLDSIPGGGAEILSDRIREKISPKKINKGRWLEVMKEAHLTGMKTTATMMFGSIEGPEDIIEHLDAIRKLQDRTGGFTAFIPWSFQPGNTELGVRDQGLGGSKRKKTNPKSPTPNPFNAATAVEYLRVLALSRIYLDNVPNIQASWVTQGLKPAQVALRFGANDFGSTMLEENVVAAAGVKYKVSINDITTAIKSAGFQPAQRDMYYNIVPTP
ncbi:MAG: dehypoxanthine futalosine cyclase [Nitrospiraceae bacterium]|nr:MAG: dehypoxanthine futalosine cyclase [Nitrospiraceae bacterium]